MYLKKPLDVFKIFGSKNSCIGILWLSKAVDISPVKTQLHHLQFEKSVSGLAATGCQT